MLRRLAISCIATALVAVLGTPAGARTRPQYGGTLRVETEGDAWQKPSGPARRLVYDGLTSPGAAGTVRPALATGWTSDNADHRWLFKLRPGVRFHDGNAVTSVAVVSALMADCGSACPWTAVRATGTSVIFTSDKSMPDLPALLAGDQFLIVETGAGSTGPASTGTSSGTGPFEPASFDHGVLTLKANETCWSGRPFLDAIEIAGRRSFADQWNDLAAGRADVVDVPAENLRAAQQQHLSVLVSQPVDTLALELSDTGALANPNVRTAIGLAIDRAALANVIYQKQGQPTAALLPQAMSGYAFLFPSARDLNKAHQLRGGVTPPALNLRVEGGGAMQLAAQRIVLNLREAGFNAQIGPGHADLVLHRIWLEGPGPEAALDRVLNAAGPTADTDPANLYEKERSFLARATIIPLVSLPRAVAISGRIHDADMRSDGTLDLSNAWMEHGR